MRSRVEINPAASVPYRDNSRSEPDCDAAVERASDTTPREAVPASDRRREPCAAPFRETVVGGTGAGVVVVDACVVVVACVATTTTVVGRVVLTTVDGLRTDEPRAALHLHHADNG